VTVAVLFAAFRLAIAPSALGLAVSIVYNALPSGRQRALQLDKANASCAFPPDFDHVAARRFRELARLFAIPG
jgi:hypothetical protein